MSSSGIPVIQYNILELLQEAQKRWLLPSEILFILTHWTNTGIHESTAPPHEPQNGSVFLFDKNKCKNFRDDGVPWVKKKGLYERVREDFVKFSAANGETAMTGFYTYSSVDSSFKRRCYRKATEGCTQFFVHYRHCKEKESKRALRQESVSNSKSVKANSGGSR